MAVNVGISVSSWNFGSVLVGTPVTKLIMFVADDGNDATATVNFGGLAAPFSISPSSLSILPGHAKNATITFTPASIASFSDTLTFTGNATLTPSTLPVSGAGAGGIVTNKYTLPAKMTASGLLNAYLFVDDQIPAITVPTGDWLIKAPKFSEKVDVNAGISSIANISRKLDNGVGFS